MCSEGVNIYIAYFNSFMHFTLRWCVLLLRLCLLLLWCCVESLVRFALNILAVLVRGFAFAYCVAAMYGRVAACYLYWRLLLLHM